MTSGTLSPAPILDAAARYRGEFVDLDTGRSISAEAFHRGRTALERELAGTGLEPGHRVVVAIGNGPHFVATLLATIACGGSPLLVHAKTPPAELKRTALRFGARLVIAGELSREELEPDFPSPTRLSVADWIDLPAARVDPRTPGFQADYIDLPGVPLHPTSGTTGVPKVAVRPGFAAVEEARHYIETIGVTAEDTILAVAPMCHAYAYGMGVMVSLVSGARLVSMRSFQASLVFQALAKERITIMPAVPVMLDVLMFGAGDRLRGSVKTVLSAGSPLSERTAERFQEKSGITIRPLYGTTETGGITVATAAEGAAGSCVGPPMRGVEAQLRNHDHQDAPPGSGRLYIRSSSMMSGYLGQGAIDTSPLDDGWFSTGDLATIDPQGRIHLLGREADVINVEGLKVIPSEVEEVIAALPGVTEVKVYAGRRKSGGQFIKAAVVGNGDVDTSAIRAHCERHLVYYKRPERIIPLAALPRSPAGKIIKDQLP